jgi:FtsP/CotA-like multicopper oxidase with cupredoxin domain
MRKSFQVLVPILLVAFATVAASAQSFRVQCPASTITHPSAGNNNTEPNYIGPGVNGAIKCQQISGGDGYATMGDGTQTYMFSFGPLSGLAKIAAGQPGTDFPSEFNTVYDQNATPLQPGDPATTDGASDAGLYSAGTLGAFGYNGAIGQVLDVANTFTIFDISEVCSAGSCTVTVVLNSQSPFVAGQQIKISGTGPNPPAAGNYDGTYTVQTAGVLNAFFPANYAFTYIAATPGLADINESSTATASSVAAIDGHVDPRQIMDVAVMNGNIPAPLMAIDEDDEYFLTLTNVGMIMRPDLFEQHTVHFHGYPNASSFYDGVPDASVAINIGASFTYYYLAPDAGTYFWHCHITPPEHLQMGMVGQLYVRPRQDRVTPGTHLFSALQQQQNDLRTACNSRNDILCSNPLPVGGDDGVSLPHSTVAMGGTGGYVYNDGDGSTWYDVEYPIQIHGFDPNFHFVGMTFNPEGFSDMKDKYFLLNGRSYPDTVSNGPQATQSVDGAMHYSQPLNAVISIHPGQRALLRISDLDVTEYQTLASLGIPMTVVGYNAKLLRDQAGNNMYYKTNSITLGGGESLDVILDTCAVRSNPADPSSSCTTPVASGTYYLYTPNLDHLSNDAENFGGLMTEVRVN